MVASRTAPDVTAQAVSSAIVAIFAALFAVVSWRALAAIPRYLSQPAWRQELIVKAKL